MAPDTLLGLCAVRLVLTAFWKAVMADRGQLSLLVRGHNLLHNTRDPALPASTNWLEDWFGRFKLRPRLARGFGTEVGALSFVRLMVHAMA